MFLDAERYRDRVGATSVIEAPQGEIADRWIVFASVESEASGVWNAPAMRPLHGSPPRTSPGNTQRIGIAVRPQVVCVSGVALDADLIAALAAGAASTRLQAALAIGPIPNPVWSRSS